MQKIIIKNFGAIKEAEIDIPKTLVLIGEQASGKSTIAKLIYFFRELRDDYFEGALSATKAEDIDFKKLIKEKFYNFFGTIISKKEFELIFYYNIDEISFVKIESNQTNQVEIILSEKLFLSHDFERLNTAIKHAKTNKDTMDSIFDLDKAKPFHEFLWQESVNAVNFYISKILNINYDTGLFIIAGRNATVQYNDLFEKYLFAEVKSRIDDNKKQKLLELKEQTVDEYLMLKFMERVSRVKTIFERNGGSFESLLKSEIKNGIYKKAENKISEILKGKYSSDKSGEKIHLENGGFVRLANASSGQQESIRILQDLFLVILRDEKVLRIVEEPEAHLFPIAQKQMIELLALMVNQNKENSLIVTTHSPYILSTFNNLLFASRVIEKNPSAESDVSEIVDVDFRLKATDFAAYTLKNTEGGFVSDSIMSDRGVIKQNYLDTASEMLSYEFNNLQLIHAKTFARK